MMEDRPLTAEGYYRDTSLAPHRQDEPGYFVPQKPSEMAGLSDEEVMRLYRKIAFSNKHQWDRQIELELIGRFTIALKGFREASETASSRLERLTWALILLTIVIAFFTVALFFRG
jgi:hypothetical protein